MTLSFALNKGLIKVQQRPAGITKQNCNIQLARILLVLFNYVSYFLFREKLEPEIPKFRPYLPPGIDFRPDLSPYFPKDFDIERPPHDNMAQAPRFLRQEHPTQYGVKDQNTNLFWFVYGYPKPKMTYYFNDELIEPGGRFDTSYTRSGQATLFINK